jgi:2-succinyl-5-enolpyruvyl-6-hydroxy-3-cyclohexene-1-carboxylate synthase
VNPSTALGIVLTDELIRCGLREAVLAPGSRSAPLALALHQRAQAGDLRLHVRIDERSAGFTALGLAKAGRRPVVVVCTSGTAAAHFHAAVIEADESAVPLIVLTADRPPELRGTGANQTIDQVKLYGTAVRWFCETGVPEPRPGMAGYWRSLICRAWALASGDGGGCPGPVHLNIPLREPLVPDGSDDWPEPLDGRRNDAPWTSVVGGGPGPGGGPLRLEWAERGVVVCGDGDYEPQPLLDLAEKAGWPVLAEPSSNARRGPNALSAYSYLLSAPGFTAAHRPEIIVSAGRPGLSRGQLALLRGSPGMPPPRHVVLAAAPGHWADPARTATEVVAGVDLASPAPGRGTVSPWLAAWKQADAAARDAADKILDVGDAVTEPRLARDLVSALPAGALLWAASSQPVRDLDLHMAPRSAIRILASRGASGIDGLVSAAIGAALAHQAAGGGPAAALLGDLALLHDAPGLVLGPQEPRPDLCLIVVSNDGGGIFSDLEQAAFPGSFERIFGTPHGARIACLAAAAGIEHARLDALSRLPDLLAGRGLRIVEAQTERVPAAGLRAALRTACAAAVS